MLVHHDERDYNTAATEAAKKARVQLEAIIDKGRTKAASVLKHIQDNQPTDCIAKGKALSFDSIQDNLRVKLGPEPNAPMLDLHRHALQQMSARVGIPWAYLDNLRERGREKGEEWARHLAAYNLNKMYQESGEANARFLLRSVNHEVRGFLSDRYRRLDSRPLLESFAKACSEVKAMPCEGYVTDTKVAVKAILPMIFEPVPNEVMAFGAVWENSDFGNGAHSIRTFCLRLWCTNYAIADLSIREVHLGSKLAEEIEWSEKTHKLDTARSASAIADVVKAHLAPASVDRFMGAIAAASLQKIDPKDVVGTLRRSLTKGETDAVVTKFNEPDVELLPPGNTMWRMSNAISWLAGETEDKERALELMKTAGSLIKAAA
jgi:hypothetical protein